MNNNMMAWSDPEGDPEGGCQEILDSSFVNRISDVDAGIGGRALRDARTFIFGQRGHRGELSQRFK